MPIFCNCAKPTVSLNGVGLHRRTSASMRRCDWMAATPLEELFRHGCDLLPDTPGRL
jgi:hypothetical protein